MDLFWMGIVFLPNRAGRSLSGRMTMARYRLRQTLSRETTCVALNWAVSL